jgi:methyl-accepting chemotaxis protein
MSAIEAQTGRVALAISDISASLAEQNAASHSVASHVESIARVSEENSQSAKLALENAKQLGALAASIQGMVKRFILGQGKK